MNITIDKAVLEQALEWFEWFHSRPMGAIVLSSTQVANMLREALAQPQPVHDDAAYKEAVSLATALFKKHFAHEEQYASGQVVWSPCDTAAGVISQIDNMVSGLVQPQPAQQCKWPTCQSEKYQQDLEDQIMRELVGEQPVQEPPVRDVEISNMGRPFAVKAYTSPQAQPAQPLSDEQAKKLCAVGPVYAPDGLVERTGQEYRRELEAARLRGLRDGEQAHGITKGTT